MALLRERASLSSLRERQINGRWSKWLRKWNDFENEMTSKMKWLLLISFLTFPSGRSWFP
jgi:hypothetical protein